MTVNISYLHPQYWRLYLLTLVLGIGGSFQYGMQISVITFPAEVAWKQHHKHVWVTHPLSKNVLLYCWVTLESGLLRHEWWTLTFLQHVQRFVNHTWTLRYGAPLSDSNSKLLWSFVLAVLSLGGWAGAIHGGRLPVVYGRWVNDPHTHVHTNTHTHTRTHIHTQFHFHIGC